MTGVLRTHWEDDGRQLEDDGASSRRIRKMTGRHFEDDGASSRHIRKMTGVNLKMTVRPQDALGR